MSNQTEKKFLSPTDLSHRWGILARTLEQWRYRGEGPPFIKIVGHVRYRIEDVKQYEQQRLMKWTGQIFEDNR